MSGVLQIKIKQLKFYLVAFAVAFFHTLVIITEVRVIKNLASMFFHLIQSKSKKIPRKIFNLLMQGVFLKYLLPIKFLKHLFYKQCLFHHPSHVREFVE